MNQQFNFLRASAPPRLRFIPAYAMRNNVRWEKGTHTSAAVEARTRPMPILCHSRKGESAHSSSSTKRKGKQARELALDAAKIEGHSREPIEPKRNPERSRHDHNQGCAFASPAKKRVHDIVNQVHTRQRRHVKTQIHHLDEQKQKTRHIAVWPGKIVNGILF